MKFYLWEISLQTLKRKIIFFKIKNKDKKTN